MAFFTWGALCAAKIGSPAGRAGSVAVWGAVAAAATAVLAAQALIQALFLVGNDAWASNPQTQEILELLGCPKAQGGLDLLLVHSPPPPVTHSVLLPLSMQQFNVPTQASHTTSNG